MSTVAKLTLGGAPVEVHIHNPEEEKPMDPKPETKPTAKKKAAPKAAKPKATAKKPPAAKKAPAPKKSAAKKAKAPKEPEPDLLGEILGAKTTLDRVGHDIQAANNVLENPDAIQIFVAAIRAADQLARSHARFDTSFDAKAKWFCLTLEGLERELHEWEDQGETAAVQILDALNKFKKSNVGIIAPLWKLVMEVVRPADKVRSYHDLSQLMQELRDAKVVVSRRTAEDTPPHAIVLGATAYLPAMQFGKPTPKAQATWPFLEEAQERARQGKNARYVELKGGATVGYKPSDAKAGKEGTIWLEVAEESGVSTFVRPTQWGIRIELRHAVGIGMPSNQEDITWLAGEAAWPDRRLFRAFQQWKQGLRNASGDKIEPAEAPVDKPKKPRRKAKKSE